jgi:hypothetical protein
MAVLSLQAFRPVPDVARSQRELESAPFVRRPLGSAGAAVSAPSCLADADAPSRLTGRLALTPKGAVRRRHSARATAPSEMLTRR